MVKNPLKLHENSTLFKVQTFYLLFETESRKLCGIMEIRKILLFFLPFYIFVDKKSNNSGLS